VDREAAALVRADWALGHLAMPILRTGGVVTVVCADPLQHEAFDELRARTGLEVELALASPSRIRELVGEVYGAGHAPEERPPLPLAEFLGEALEQRASHFGISVRTEGTWGWYSRAGVDRRPLCEGWETQLAEFLTPAAAEIPGNGVALASWSATLRHGGKRLPVDVQALAGSGGAEYLFRPRYAPGNTESLRTLSLPPAIAAELRLLASAGSARVAVVSPEDADLGRAVLPYLPGLIRWAGMRSVHVTEGEEPGGGVFTLRADPEVLPVLGAYHFDAITLDLPAGAHALEELLGAAHLAFACLDASEPERRRAELAIDWVLSVRRDVRGELSWDLRSAA
jgi:hypothetical protein